MLPLWLTNYLVLETYDERLEVLFVPSWKTQVCLYVSILFLQASLQKQAEKKTVIEFIIKEGHTTLILMYSTVSHVI